MSISQQSIGPARARVTPSAPSDRTGRSFSRVAAALLLVLALGLSASPAFAHDHDPEDAAHPVRIVAYLLHPIGVILDYLLVRPAHWIVSHEPMQTLFGHDPDDDSIWGPEPEE